MPRKPRPTRRAMPPPSNRKHRFPLRRPRTQLPGRRLNGLRRSSANPAMKTKSRNASPLNSPSRSRRARKSTVWRTPIPALKSRRRWLAILNSPAPRHRPSDRKAFSRQHHVHRRPDVGEIRRPGICRSPRTPMRSPSASQCHRLRAVYPRSARKVRPTPR